MPKFLLAAMLFAGLAAAALCAEEIMSAPDEQVVAQIIADLGSVDPQVRAAASQKLTDCGPDIIPALQKYADADDPEIAARISSIVHSFGWMRDGAIVLDLEEGWPGEREGLLRGDVIVKIDESDVKVRGDVSGFLKGRNNSTLYVWRDGHIRKIKVSAEKLGATLANWEIARGGNDQSRGIAALSRESPDRAEAYRRLKAAREKGMNDPRTTAVLAGAASTALDRDLANKCYAESRRERDCNLSHDDSDYRMGNVAFNGPHCEYLLGRYHAEPFSTELYHEMEDWFARHGRNRLLAEQLLDKPWPVPETQVAGMQRYYHEIAKMLVRIHQRRYDDVMTIFDGRVIPDYLWYDRETIAIQAAVRGGRAADAARIGRLMLDQKDRGSDEKPTAALWGLAAAAAMGEEVAADEFLAKLDRLEPPAREALFKYRSMDALNQPAAADRIRAWIARRPRAEVPDRFEQIALARLIAAPPSTSDEFAAAIKGYESAKSSGEYKLTLLTGYLRFEKYDQARQAAMALRAAKAKTGKAEGPRERALATLDFVQAHAREFEGPWKDLSGAVEIAPADGATWALRFDGAVFRIDAAGAIHAFEGLPIPPAPITIGYRHLRITPHSAAVLYPYGRSRLDRPNGFCPDLIFLLDLQKNRWTPLEQFEGAIDLGDDDDHHDTARAVALRMAAQSYPPLIGAMPREHREKDNYHWFDGDIMIYVDPESKHPTDLSKEIGRLAGRAGAAHVYRLENPRDARLIYTDSGLWAFDPAGPKLERIALGLKDENVMMCAMPESSYGRREDGTLLIGVAPQQGGRIFIVDPKTRAVKPTGGFCGLGPADWYGGCGEDWTRRDPQPAIHAQYLLRIAAK